VSEVVFNPDGRMVATGRWCAGVTGSSNPITAYKGGVSTSVFRRDGQVIASGGAD
jgi:hypothetical protein